MQSALKRIQAGDRIADGLEPHNHLSQFNVLSQLDHLRSYKVVQERLNSGKLRLHAWYFDIAEAEVLAYDDREKRFMVIDDAEATRIIGRLKDK